MARRRSLSSGVQTVSRWNVRLRRSIPIKSKPTLKVALAALLALALPILSACGGGKQSSGTDAGAGGQTAAQSSTSAQSTQPAQPQQPAPEPTTFKCGSQGYAEVEIQCEIVKHLIEARTPHKVQHVTGLGSSMAALQAIENNDLQFIISFVGTLMLGLYEDQVTREHYDPQKAWQFVHDNLLKDRGLWVLEPYGYNNTYALIMRRDRAAELGVTKTSDLAKYAADMILATDDSWQNYPGQGYKEWQEIYGFKFKDAVEMDYGLLYRATANGDVDAAMAYSTDGRIKALDLVVIEDDKQFNPPYHGMLVMRNDVKEKYPEVYELLTQLQGRTTTGEMISLNMEVDVNEEEPSDVAREWLKAQGLID